MYKTLSTKFKRIEAPLLNAKCHEQPTFNITYTKLFRSLYKTALSGVSPQSTLIQSIFIDDYPCPADLFAHFRRYLKSRLEILDEVMHLSKKLLLDLLRTQSRLWDENKILVGVHVRRRDYFHHMNVLFDRSVLSFCYYLNAFNYMREK